MDLFYILLVLLGGLFFLVARKPDIFRVTRAIVIAAPPEAIFAHVNNLRKWEGWSPWAVLDPNQKVTFAGPDAGAGAAMSWNGNNKVGAGTMTITESTPAKTIRFRLDFEKPMKGTSDATFEFMPEGGGTAVHWSMEGKNSPMAKLMSLFMNCEKMVGTQFEKGLASLKKLAEKT